MVVLGGVVGAIVGSLLALLITVVQVGLLRGGFNWVFWTDILLPTVGAVIGWTFARGSRLPHRRGGPPVGAAGLRIRSGCGA
jgi:uncharacterized membrane protein YqaE (UPF0057 family)